MVIACGGVPAGQLTIKVSRTIPRTRASCLALSAIPARALTLVNEPVPYAIWASLKDN